MINLQQYILSIARRINAFCIPPARQFDRMSRETEAMFTRDRFHKKKSYDEPKIGQDRPPVYTGPFWNRSETELNGSKTGPAVLDPFGSVPDRFQNIRVLNLDWFQTVPCKQKPIRSGSVRNGSGPVPYKHSLSR